ncbi:MAG: sigma-70 family RNA polymerase sigma factor [Solirubrobacterales bacterium]
MRPRGSPFDQPHVFGSFYTERREPLLRFFAQRVYDPQLALDLCAETFAQAFLKRLRFRGSVDPDATAWLYAIANRRLIDYYRRGEAEKKALKRLGIELPPAGRDELDRVEELADLGAARAAIRDGFQQLNQDEQLALRLRIVEERSYQDVASTLGTSVPTARTRVSRALRALRESVEMELPPKEMT